MKMLDFYEFSMNEKYNDPINRMHVLISSILSTLDSKDKFSVDTSSYLSDVMRMNLKIKDMKTEVIPLIAKKIDLEVSILTKLISTAKKNPATLDRRDHVERAYLENIKWVKDMRLNPWIAINFLKGYFKNIHNPKITGFSKIDDLGIEDLGDNFKGVLRLKSSKTIINSKMTYLFEFNRSGNKKQDDDSILEKIKKMEYPIEDTVKMIRIGLNNMRNIDLTPYDVILAPKSSSKVLVVFADELKSFIEYQQEATGKLKNPPKICLDAFEKIPGKDITWDEKGIEKISDENIKNLIRKLQVKIKKKGNEGISLVHDVWVSWRRYLTNFMRLTQAGKSAITENVLLIDDFTTSGTTIDEMRKLIGKKTFAITIFKVTGFKDREMKNFKEFLDESCYSSSEKLDF